MQAKILLVDDEPTLRRVLAQVLEDDGAKLTVADSAEDAINKISNNFYDLLVVDKNLPAQNGIDLAAQLIKNHQVKAALMITGYPSVRSLIEACNADIGGYLIKPFAKLQTLLDEVHRILKKRNAAADQSANQTQKTEILAQDILRWLQFDQGNWNAFDRIGLDLHDPQLALRVGNHIHRLGNQLVAIHDAPEVIVGDQFESLMDLLNQRAASAALYIGPSLGFSGVLEIMHRGQVAIATEAMFSTVNNEELQQ